MKPRLVIAGAGPTGLALATRSVTQRRPILIDIEPKQVALGEAIEGVEVVTGDATSMLVLKRANLDGVSYAVAATGDDEVNLEFCRLMKENFAVSQLVALVRDPVVAERLRLMGVVTISRPASVASILESSLDRGRRTTSDIGLGEGEIYEVTVQSHSPVIGKSLSILRPQSWLLGAIYREGKLVVPHGKTKIESGDKCLLIGEPGVLQGIADYFQRGSSEFPLQFGTRYCMLESRDKALPNLDECEWLTENTEAKGLRLLRRSATRPVSVEEKFGDTVPGRALPEGPIENLIHLTDELDCAMLLTAPPKLTFTDKLGLGNRELFRLLDGTPEPILISRGSHPYKRILVAISPSPGSLRAAELAVDVARKFDADLTAIGVQPPDFVVGSEYKDKLNKTMEAIRAKAHLYSRRIDIHIVEGNPVTQVLEHCKDFDLLVIAHRRFRRFSFTQTDVSRHLVVGAPCSVMVLPFAKEDLGHGV